MLEIFLLYRFYCVGQGMNRMNVMEQVHLAGEEEDDYSGFNDYNATLDVDVSERKTSLYIIQ